jgi:ATP-dependent Clp protease protease subunit
MSMHDRHTRFDDEDEDKDSKEGPAHTPRLIEESLFKRRYVLITGTINDKIARLATERLLALAAANDEPINIFISSPGGHVESGDMIHDVIKFIRPEVRTIGSGWVASAGALIFVAADKHRRFCLPNTRFLLHQPSGAAGGTAADIEIQADQLRVMRERFNRLFSEATGQTEARIAQDTNRDFWLTTTQAIDYGLLGAVVKTVDDLDRLSK